MLNVIRHWNKLPKEVVELQSLEGLKKHRNVVFRGMVDSVDYGRLGSVGLIARLNDLKGLFHL